MRPFVLHEDAGRAGEPSAATWQGEPEPEMPTQLLPAVPAVAPAPARRGYRSPRPLLLIGAGVAAVLAVGGYAVLRPALRPAVSATLPDQGLPVVTGPAPSVSPSPVGDPAGSGDTDTGGAGADPDGGSGNETTAPGTTAPRTATASASAAPSAAPSSVAASRTAGPAPAPPAELVPSPLLGETAALVSGNGLCLDLQGGDAEEGREVHVDDCNGTSPQRWRLNDNRTLQVADLCAYLVGDGGVELTGCDTRTTAQWQQAGEGVLTNAANGLCLTDPHFGARPATQVIVASCTGRSNQRWTFR